jgi:hypothetical protein
MKHPGNKEDIITCENDLLAAFKNKDFRRLDELLHDGLLFVIPNGQIKTKAVTIEMYRSGDLFIDSISSSDQQIYFIGDNAVVSFILEMRGKYFDQRIDGKFQYLRVWKLFGDTWKVIAGSGVQL